jgi:tRNA (guanine-N7-)-methyltransferase
MHSAGAAPARPEAAARGIRSYTRRGTRLNAGQQQAWDTYAARWVLESETQTGSGLRLDNVFEQSAPLLVEIGFGIGEALAPAVAARPDWNLLGFEVWQPGVAECLAALSSIDSGNDNVRLSTLDAAWCFEHLVEPGSVSELWTFFPDPWPKSRHHKRRLVSPAFARLAASRLAPDGVWRLATDWDHYAEQMREVLDGVPDLSGGVTDRYDGRPLTRFERRGLAAGRTITDLTYTQTVGPTS